MKNSSTPVRNAVLNSTEFPWKWNLEDLAKKKKNGCTVFSCFSCGGGSSMGYKLAGYDVVGCCEIDPAMMKVYKENNHPKHTYLMDIREFLKLPDDKIPDDLRNLDVLDGSPPCSVFSTAGRREEGWSVEKTFREGQAKQRLDDLFLYFIEVAKRLQPKVVIAENVRGLIGGKAKGWVNQIIRAFDDAGYKVQIFLLDASRMGVPQTRERVFFVAGRKDLEFSKIKMEFNSRVIPFMEVREPVGKKLSEDNIVSKLIKYRIPSDRLLSDISDRVRRKHTGYTSPINHDDEPAHTITAGGYCIRMFDGMLMTDKEIIWCQTFPQDYNFLDQDVQYVCGMSVPPVMMAKISEQVYLQWLRGLKK